MPFNLQRIPIVAVRPTRHSSRYAKSIQQPAAQPYPYRHRWSCCPSGRHLPRPDAVHLAFPDGAEIVYEPATGALSATGITTENGLYSSREPAGDGRGQPTHTLDAPIVVCTQQLVTGTIQIKQGGTMTGNLEHSSGHIISNGVVVDSHTHEGIHRGEERSDSPT
ncbi:MAG: phage baseplate assembly protein V [Gibbsiella quercinecans]|uniref:phage baseplate assembly protein V n=1 Tax=Gibbsiella quercinecans TaxID=929813 RepID=UPI003F318871